MKRITIALLLTIIQFYCFSQEMGKPFITNFKSSEYKAHAQNFDVIQDNRGIMYFANGDGLLEYDGSRWKIIELKNKVGLRSITSDSLGRIYIGATNCFGYMQPNKNGTLEFISLTDKLNANDKKVKDIWQTLLFGKCVYFRSLDKLYCYHNDTVTVSTSKSPINQLFTFNGKLYIYEPENGLVEIRNNKFIYAKNSLEKTNLSSNYIRQFDNERIIIFSSINGLFWYYPQTDKLVPFHTQIDNILFKNSPYTGFINKNQINIGCNGIEWTALKPSNTLKTIR